MAKENVRNMVSKRGALEQVAEYVLDCETGEYDSYVTHCFENELEPFDLRGAGQSEHIYALALIGLGLEFPIDGSVCPQCASESCTPIQGVKVAGIAMHGCDDCGHTFKADS